MAWVCGFLKGNGYAQTRRASVAAISLNIEGEGKHEENDPDSLLKSRNCRRHRRQSCIAVGYGCGVLV